MGCLFCNIIDGKIPSTKLYEDDKMLVFRDIEPQAPFHCLAVLKGEPHLDSLADLAAHPERATDVGYLLTVIAQKQSEWGLDANFRVISNCGVGAGQTVSHLHFHILGGTELSVRLG